MADGNKPPVVVRRENCGYEEVSTSEGRECYRRCVRPKDHDKSSESDMKQHAFDNWCLR